MAQTSTTDGLTRAASSIVPEEVEQFGRMAADWWNPKGPSAMLHKLHPVRLKYVRDQIDQHWQCDECGREPLTGKTALDVGCGAGLLDGIAGEARRKGDGHRCDAAGDPRGSRTCRRDGVADRISGR